MLRYFKNYKKRSRNVWTNNFHNGKAIRDDQRILHVQVQIPVPMRTKQSQQRHFAIPFLGNKTGKFGNVNISVMNDLHKLLPNGLSISEHNAILTQISHSIENYSICDNVMNPIMVTFNSGSRENHSVHLEDSTYGEITSFCEASSHIMQSFVFYC